jgi:hypothetical protein
MGTSIRRTQDVPYCLAPKLRRAEADGRVDANTLQKKGEYVQAIFVRIE